MKSQSQDILAKLLATENITVTRSNVATASFDIKNRVLLLPTWKDFPQEVEEMLILHEVGHALFTSEEGYGVVFKEKRYLNGYANIIEDVRIEKKMKERYPGSRKTFNSGYTQLNERDFFGIKDQDLNELLLIDKINLYYKAGYACGVTFTAEEYEFVRKADQCETEEDVIALAEEIWNFSEQKILEETDHSDITMSIGLGDGDNEDEYDFLNSSDEDISDQLEAQTNKAFAEALDNQQDRESRTFYLEPKFEISSNKSPIVPHKQILAKLQALSSPDRLEYIKRNANKFKAESNGIVNYLVKEFEMRKSASAYKRTKISKLGQLDVNKLFAYKLKDDIFKQIAIVQEGKKHGMIFLLDWSGSMSQYMHETVEQVINLAMFCQKIKIPYQVFAFTDGYGHDSDDTISTKSMHANGVDNMHDFKLLELFSEKMNTKDFNSMLELLLSDPWNTYDRSFRLNGTPLNHSLLYMADYIGEYIRMNNVEKMNLIVLTDGESNCLHHNDYANKGRPGIKSGTVHINENGNLVKVNATTYLRDPITHKQYEFNEDAGVQTQVLMTLLKDRYALHTIGFYITSSSFKNVHRFVYMNYASTRPSNGDKATVIQSMLRKNKSVILKDIRGRDEMYVILSTNKIENEDLEDISYDMTASQISKQLSKVFTSRKTSRVVLNSFIGVVA